MVCKLKKRLKNKLDCLRIFKIQTFIIYMFLKDIQVS